VRLLSEYAPQAGIDRSAVRNQPPATVFHLASLIYPPSALTYEKPLFILMRKIRMEMRDQVIENKQLIASDNLQALEFLTEPLSRKTFL
jgi:hypothetical protein